MEEELNESGKKLIEALNEESFSAENLLQNIQQFFELMPNMDTLN